MVNNNKLLLKNGITIDLTYSSQNSTNLTQLAISIESKKSEFSCIIFLDNINEIKKIYYFLESVIEMQFTFDTVGEVEIMMNDPIKLMLIDPQILLSAGGLENKIHIRMSAYKYVNGNITDDRWLRISIGVTKNEVKKLKSIIKEVIIELNCIWIKNIKNQVKN